MMNLNTLFDRQFQFSRKLPKRPWGLAIRKYWRPRRLTLKSNPPIYAWLIFNFTYYDPKEY